MTALDDALAMAGEVPALDEKATAGPWERRFYDQNEVETRDGIRVATFNEARRDTWHNARLIASYRTAAPDLARALKAVAEALENEGPPPLGVIYGPQYCAAYGDAVRSIRAAIERRLTGQR